MTQGQAQTTSAAATGPSHSAYSAAAWRGEAGDSSRWYTSATFVNCSALAAAAAMDDYFDVEKEEEGGIQGQDCVSYVVGEAGARKFASGRKRYALVALEADKHRSHWNQQRKRPRV